MERNGEGSFLTVRRPSQGPHRGSAYHPASGAGAVGSTAWIGKGFSCVCAHGIESDAYFSFDITLSQEESLHKLQSRTEEVYDGSNKEHQSTPVFLNDLATVNMALWYAAYPGVELHGLVSEQWKDMGWQGKDPSTDFRGGGFISLENLLFFARSYPKSFQDLLQKLDGNRAMWEYPFAVAGVNITFMLIQMLELQHAKPRSCIGAIFLKLLSENSQAFDILYCITFKLMDQQWLDMHASYMDFNAVMKSTRCRLEKELLMKHVSRIEDLPSYTLLIP